MLATALLQPARSMALQSIPMAVLGGEVRDASNRPVSAATIRLQAQDKTKPDGERKTLTDGAGLYRFSDLKFGEYSISVEIAGKVCAVRTISISTSEFKLDLATDSPLAASSMQPEFSDDVHFTVAGVTDTTNLGGHGSDVVVRNRQAVAEATAALRQTPDRGPPLTSSSADAEKALRERATEAPDDFTANYRLGKWLSDAGRPQEAIPYLEKGQFADAHRFETRHLENRYELALAYARSGAYDRARSGARSLLSTPNLSPDQSASLHHLLGDADEGLGNPLEAVREYEEAARLGPSEINLFDWGAELLLHRAAEPALEVFTKAHRLFPQSARVLMGLGAAFYAIGSYDKAVQTLCDAADLDPADPNPYLLLGKMQTVEPVQSPAMLERLARFVSLDPQNALANYYYALSLRKRRTSPDDVRDLAQVKSLLVKAIQLDPSLGLAYLELGNSYAEQKDLAEAISAYRHAIAATPSLGQAHYRLAQLYRQTGESGKARSELQSYKEISSGQQLDLERQHHEVQQFVYRMRTTPAASQP
jgi:tetratricopeptide (TPR) repeat protein